jgi:hypothetical protein
MAVYTLRHNATFLSAQFSRFCTNPLEKGHRCRMSENTNTKQAEGAPDNVKGVRL